MSGHKKIREKKGQINTVVACQLLISFWHVTYVTFKVTYFLMLQSSELWKFITLKIIFITKCIRYFVIEWW